MDKKHNLFVVIVITVMLLVGCWDRVEIERNAFILGIGIDQCMEDKIMVTYQIALPAAMLGGAGQGEGGGGKEPSTLNISIESESMKKAEQTLLATLNQVPSYSHLQLVVFGQELCRKGIGKHIDFLIREPEMRQRTKVAVSTCKASEIFKIQPKTVKSTSQYISDLLDENERRSMVIIMYIDLAMLQKSFIRGFDFCFTKITPKKDTLNLEGAGAFRHGRLIGWLTDSEVMALKWLQGESSRGVISIENNEWGSGNVYFKIVNNETVIKPYLEDNKFLLKMDMHIEGDIAEIENEGFDVYEITFMNQVEKAIEKKIIESCKRVFYKLRDVYQIDCFEFGRRVEDYYPEFWERNKGHWRNYFINSDFDIKVHARVRRLGVTK